MIGRLDGGRADPMRSRLSVGYDTPERVADVFGHSNAIPLPGVGGGIRQGAMGGLATLQQALGARGIQLQSTDDEEGGDESNGRSQDSSLSRQEVRATAIDRLYRERG